MHRTWRSTRQLRRVQWTGGAAGGAVRGAVLRAASGRRSMGCTKEQACPSPAMPMHAHYRIGPRAPHRSSVLCATRWQLPAPACCGLQASTQQRWQRGSRLPCRRSSGVRSLGSDSRHIAVAMLCGWGIRHTYTCYEKKEKGVQAERGAQRAQRRGASRRGKRTLRRRLQRRRRRALPGRRPSRRRCWAFHHKVKMNKSIVVVCWFAYSYTCLLRLRNGPHCMPYRRVQYRNTCRPCNGHIKAPPCKHPHARTQLYA